MFFLDLNHYNDDAKKQMFFPINGVNGDELDQHNPHEDVMIDVTSPQDHPIEHQIDEANDQDHQMDPEAKQPDIQSSDLISAAERIIQENASSSICSDKRQIEPSRVLQTQPHIRNLNLDLGVETSEATMSTKSIIPSLSTVTSETVTSSSSKTDRDNGTALVMFESQKSYHNIDVSPTCLDLKTPTKVTLIQEPVVKAVDESNRNDAPLQDIGEF